MFTALHYASIAVSIFVVAGTLLSFSRHPHWIFRAFDFPRIQIATLALIAAIGLAAAYRRYGNIIDATLLVLTVAVIVVQFLKIYTHTRLGRTQVKVVPPDQIVRDRCLSLMMSNVLMENEAHERFIDLVREQKPDVLLAVEIDHRWARAMEVLDHDYPYRLKQPLDNYYGMVLLSKLELLDPRVEFLVQDDIPSIRSGIRLRSGEEIVLRGIHPRPPEPFRDQRSTPRDAELVIVGKQIENDPETPTIVAGDLNDVAWSATSELFVRLSGLLDPRVGRGMFNSYNANNPLFRYPLDHVFHSNHFRLISLKRLGKIGSDHFPILIELFFDPEAKEAQPRNQKKSGDDAEAAHKLEKESEDAATGKDRPNDG